MRDKQVTVSAAVWMDVPFGDTSPSLSAVKDWVEDSYCLINATRMIVSDDTSVMLAVEAFFKGFIAPQEIADTSTSREVVVGLSAESREQVDDLAEKGGAAGGQALGEPQDDGFMYMRGFSDHNGHQWSFIYMDMSAIP